MCKLKSKKVQTRTDKTNQSKRHYAINFEKVNNNEEIKIWIVIPGTLIVNMQNVSNNLPFCGIQSFFFSTTCLKLLEIHKYIYPQ